VGISTGMRKKELDQLEALYPPPLRLDACARSMPDNGPYRRHRLILGSTNGCWPRRRKSKAGHEVGIFIRVGFRPGLELSTQWGSEAMSSSTNWFRKQMKGYVTYPP
jgi:hypothetical protein